MVVFGRAGTLKTWLSMHLAEALSTGREWVGFPTKPCSVLVVQSEQTEHLYRRRWVKFTQNMNGSTPQSLFFDNDLTLKLDGFHGIGALEQDIQECQPDVIILDCLYKMISGVQSNEQDLKRFINGMAKIQQEYKSSFVILHHPRKESDEDRGFDEMLTSSIFADWVDTIVRVRSVPPDADQPTLIELKIQKAKNAEGEVPNVVVKFDRETAKFSLR